MPPIKSDRLLGDDWQDWLQRQQAATRAALDAIGHTDWNPFICRGVFTEDTAVFGAPLVSDPTSETDPLTDNYIQWILGASVDDLDANKVPYHQLLYLLLRYSALIECSNTAMDLLIQAGMAGPADRYDNAMIQIVPGTEQRFTMRQQLQRAIAGTTHGKTLGQYLSPGGGATVAALDSFRQALATLTTVPTAELERLFTETLDLATDRLDTWITSLATQRLGQMRTSAPTGTHIGAMAWVENLKPADPTAAAYGFVHAPSATHAATAAVLRNAFLSYAGTPNAEPYAINLSSARVRAGRFVLDSVRQGQPVGAIFGYQIERGLRDRQADVLIDPLRRMYPLVANKTADSGKPADVVAARNVVDGLALRTAARATGGLPYDRLGIARTSQLRAALDAEIAALEETVDSVADLLLAESVHQIVRGNASAASASLDNLAVGARPPDPDVAQLPRGGTLVTHRVGVVVGGAPLGTGAGWPAAATPRAAAEPRLDAWVGGVLGDPRAARCRVVYFDANGHASGREVTMDTLGLRPLDVLALAGTVTTTPMASELDRRVVDAALGGNSGATSIRILYDPDTSWDRTVVRSFPEMFTLARAVQDTVAAARTLAPTDLVPLYQAEAARAAGGWQAAEAMARATAAESALTAAGAAVHAAVQGGQASALRAALVTASLFGIPAAFPATAGVDEGSLAPSLLAQARSVDAEIARRLVGTASHHPAAGATAADQVKAAQTMVQDIFGADFVLAPGFTPTAPADLTPALAYSGTLVPDATEPARWLERVARVRAPIARWRVHVPLRHRGGRDGQQ